MRLLSSSFDSDCYDLDTITIPLKSWNLFIAMALVVKYVYDLHTHINKYGDPRTANWLFISSPFYTMGICLSYVYIVKLLGPKLMEKRKPFQLRKILIAYNLFNVIFNAWLFYEGGMSGWLTGRYSWRCQPVDYSNHPDTIRMTHVAWWYYFSKFIDLTDTIFFVLRKKHNQITTLHVIHHSIMPMSCWLGVKFYPGGHGTFFGLLNTFVHVVMYSYYLLAALGPQMQKYLWWKKYLTTLQMVQFLLVFVHTIQLLFIDCNYPRGVVWLIGIHAVMFFFLFKDFYHQAYDRKMMKKVQATANGHSNDHGIHSNNQNGYAKENGNIFKQNGVKYATDYYSKPQFSKLHQRIKVQ